MSPLVDSPKAIVCKRGLLILSALLSAVLFAFGFSACKSKPITPVTVLARVGEKILSDEELKAWESSFPNGKLSNELRSAYIRNWVEDELLVNAARERGLDDDPWIESRIDELRREFLKSRLLEIDAATIPRPSTKEVLEYFNQHSDEFTWNKVHLDVIYWHSTARPPLDRLRSVLAQNRPSPLLPAEVASIDSGRLDIDDPTIVDPAVWKHIGWMSAGQLGFPVAIRGSYWLFKINRRDESGTAQRLEDVVDIITSRITESARITRRNEIVKKYAEQFRNEGRLLWINPTNTTNGTTNEEKNTE